MYKLFQKLLAALAFVKKVTPMIDDSVDDVTSGLQTTADRLGRLREKKQRAVSRINEMRRELEVERSVALTNIMKSERVQENINKILEG